VTNGYVTGTIIVVANGIELGDTDIVATNGSTVVLNSARNSGDIVRIKSGVSSTTANTLTLPRLSSAPTVVAGTFAVADGVSWDPATKANGKSYPVFYDGTTWNALY